MSTSKQRTCKKCEKDFLIIPQEEHIYKTNDLPEPIHCPSCRHSQRMALRNERKLYKDTCDKCGKDMLSTYPQDAPYTVYCQDCFWKNIT